MRVFIAVLVLIFSLQSWTKADDISDFEIEGMSARDSLLKYITKAEIEKKKSSYSDKGYIYPSKKYYALTFNDFPNLKQYDQLQFHLKDKDNTYKIYGLAGVKLFTNNFESCYELMDTIELELDNTLKSATKEKYPRKESWTGKGYITSIYYWYDNLSSINIACEDWSKESNISDGLAVSIVTSSMQSWINSQ